MCAVVCLRLDKMIKDIRRRTRTLRIRKRAMTKKIRNSGAILSSAGGHSQRCPRASHRHVRDESTAGALSQYMYTASILALVVMPSSFTSSRARCTVDRLGA